MISESKIACRMNPALTLMPKAGNFSVPGEFEHQDAVWLGWPVHENKKGVSTVPLVMQMLRELTPHVPVRLAVQDSNEMESVKKLLREQSIPADRIAFHMIPHGDIWFRDMGPIFLTDSHSRKKIADFDFNQWSYDDGSSYETMTDEKVDREAAAALKLDTTPSELISEGGDRESNGKGTMIVTESVELQRNPNLSRQEIENELKRVLGMKKIIWLRQGLYEDDLTYNGPVPGPSGAKDAYTTFTTGGHIDEFCRFAGPSTILFTGITSEEAAANPIARENYRRMKENLEILQHSTDQDGNPFKIILMPAAEPLYVSMEPGDGVYDALSELEFEDGHQFPAGKPVNVIEAASYLNFLISNGIVIGQKFWKPGLPEKIREKDEESLRILQSVFPDRHIVQIDALPLNIAGGGIHCITQQEPASEESNYQGIIFQPQKAALRAA